MSRRALALSTTLAMLVFILPAAAAPPHEEFIVVLKSTDRPVAEVAKEISENVGGEVGAVFTHALQGFLMQLPAPAAQGLSRNPQVAYIEPVREIAVAGTQPIPEGIDRIDWDLNRVTEPMDVDIAILDTGAYIGQNPDGSARSHFDLNLQWVSDCTGALFYPMFGSGCTGSGDPVDRHGHATHVAGIAGALDNDFGSIGVASGAVLWSFKVLQDDGFGTTGMLLAGIDGVASLADQIEVANMSLGFVGSSQAIDDAIANATDAGVVFVVAAGNDAIDASQFSPANAPDALAVSAIADFDGLPGGLASPTCRSDQDDTLADFSNFGPTVAIAAPGVCIFSTDLGDGYSVKSGTSMASPFMAGAIARYIAENDLPTSNRADVEAIKAAVVGAGIAQTSTCGFTDVDSSPEPLLFVNGPLYGGDGTCGSGSPPPENQPPTASFTSLCIDLACDFTNTSSDPDPGDTLTHSWDFGDGASSTDESPSHVYASAGTFTVSLDVSDGVETVSTSSDVTVTEPAANEPPSASFVSSCVDLACDFTNTSSDPDPGDTLTYSWDFGDGASNTVESPSHVYATAGTFTVSLDVSDGVETVSTSSDVTVTEPAGSTDITIGVNPILLDGREAEISFNIFDGDGNYVSEATVEGVWTYTDRRGREKTSASSTVSTDPFTYSGAAVNALISKRFPPGSTVISFCVNSVSAPGYTYIPPPLQCGFPLS